MATEKTLQAFRDYMECRIRRGSDLRRDSTRPKPFITLSRQAGARGTTIGRELVSYLSGVSDASEGCPWVLMDKDLTARVIAEHGLPERLERYLGETKISELSDLMDEVLGLHPSTLTLVRQTSETILRLAQAGHVVLVGRGANHVTGRLPGGFHVRLVSSPKRRLEHLRVHHALDAEQAAALMKREDQGRADYVRRNFNADIDDPLSYDLVLNVDRFDTARAARLIGDAALAKVYLYRSTGPSPQVHS